MCEYLNVLSHIQVCLPSSVVFLIPPLSFFAFPFFLNVTSLLTALSGMCLNPPLSSLPLPRHCLTETAEES